MLHKQNIFAIYFIQVILFIESIEFIDSFCIYLERFQQIYVHFSKSQRFEFPNVFVNLSASKAEKKIPYLMLTKTSGFGSHFRP